MGTRRAPYLDLARQVRLASGLAVIHAARITDAATANHAIESGALDMVGMVSPHIMAKLMAGQEDRIRPCVGAGLCVDRVDRGGDMICVHNVSAGRERTFPDRFGKALEPRKVVVVGGGPAGLEAARVARTKGHKVILLEASDRTGGQILLAARARSRRDMVGISDWLSAEIERLGVDVRFNLFAEADDVLSHAPDVVILATGGIPQMRLDHGGENFATSSWDALTLHKPLDGRCLIYDETGSHSAISLAETLAADGADVEVMTPYSEIGNSLGGQTRPQYLEELYSFGVRLSPDHKLLGLRREGNGLIATVKNMFTRDMREHAVDHVILEQGTVPMDDLFNALRGQARNRGVTDWDALADGVAQPKGTHTDGAFDLYAVGDAVSGRDIHAAMFEANRIARTL